MMLTQPTPDLGDGDALHLCELLREVRLRAKECGLVLEHRVIVSAAITASLGHT